MYKYLFKEDMKEMKSTYIIILLLSTISIFSINEARNIIKQTNKITEFAIIFVVIISLLLIIFTSIYLFFIHNIRLVRRDIKFGPSFLLRIKSFRVYSYYRFAVLTAATLFFTLYDLAILSFCIKEDFFQIIKVILDSEIYAFLNIFLIGILIVNYVTYYLLIGNYRSKTLFMLNCLFGIVNIIGYYFVYWNIMSIYHASVMALAAITIIIISQTSYELNQGIEYND